MRLIEGLTPTKVGDSYIVVPAGKSMDFFHGMIRNNETAHFIYELLTSETTEDSLVNELLKKYNVDEKSARKDVDRILQQLRNAGLLDEI